MGEPHVTRCSGGPASVGPIGSALERVTWLLRLMWRRRGTCDAVEPGDDGRRGDGTAAEDDRGGRRPDGVSDQIVEALGRASEGFEYLERARGHLYSAHQLIGRADLLFEAAAAMLDDCGAVTDARRLREEVVGRNVLDGRGTFQIVEEFDDLYYGPVREEVRSLEERHVAGRRHVYESELKDPRRSRGPPGHERRPPDPHSAEVDADG